jgi:hypothetical protein
MEGEQRIAINATMPSHITKGVFAKKKERVTLLLFFPKYNTKKTVMSVFDKYPSIQKVDDKISNDAIEKLCSKHSPCLWAVLNPQTYTLLGGSLNDKTDDLYERKRLFVIHQEKLFIFKENPEQWFFYYKDDIVKSKGDEEEDDAKILEKNKKHNEEMFKKDEMAKRATEKLFTKVEDVYDFSNLKWVSFEQTSTPMLNLKFGK